MGVEKSWKVGELRIGRTAAWPEQTNHEISFPLPSLLSSAERDSGTLGVIDGYKIEGRRICAANLRSISSPLSAHTKHHQRSIPLFVLRLKITIVIISIRRDDLTLELHLILILLSWNREKRDRIKNECAKQICRKCGEKQHHAQVTCFAR